VYVDPKGRESLSTMIDNAEQGCHSGFCAFGYRFLGNLYKAGSLGFASIHDPAKDAYDNGKISGKQYAAASTVALAAPVVTVGTAGFGVGAVAATTTIGGRALTTAAISAAYGTTLDVATQSTLLATGVQEHYDDQQTVDVATTSAILGPLTVEAGNGLTSAVQPAISRVRSALAVRAAQQGRQAVVIEGASSNTLFERKSDLIPDNDFGSRNPMPTPASQAMWDLRAIGKRESSRADRGLNLNITERGLLAQEREQAATAGWKRPDGSTWWPPYDGAIPGTQRTVALEQSVMDSQTLIDRFGKTAGTFVSPAGASLESRALSYRPNGPPSIYSGSSWKRVGDLGELKSL